MCPLVFLPSVAVNSQIILRRTGWVLFKSTERKSNKQVSYQFSFTHTHTRRKARGHSRQLDLELLMSFLPWTHPYDCIISRINFEDFFTREIRVNFNDDLIKKAKRTVFFSPCSYDGEEEKDDEREEQRLRHDHSQERINFRLSHKTIDFHCEALEDDARWSTCSSLKFSLSLSNHLLYNTLDYFDVLYLSITFVSLSVSKQCSLAYTVFNACRRSVMLT